MCRGFLIMIMRVKMVRQCAKSCDLARSGRVRAWEESQIGGSGQDLRAKL
jgi:hypothetical protein